MAHPPTILYYFTSRKHTFNIDHLYAADRGYLLGKYHLETKSGRKMYTVHECTVVYLIYYSENVKPECPTTFHYYLKK